METDNAINKQEDTLNSGWEGLDQLQDQIMAWQKANFPNCEEWELYLGAAEEVGELVQCFLKMHRGIRTEEFDDERLQDALGDTIIYLIGVCGARNWRISEVLRSTSRRVLERNWS